MRFSVSSQGVCWPVITAWSSALQLLQAPPLCWTSTLLQPICSISGVCYLEPRSSFRTWNAKSQGTLSPALRLDWIWPPLPSLKQSPFFFGIIHCPHLPNSPALTPNGIPTVSQITRPAILGKKTPRSRLFSQSCCWHLCSRIADSIMFTAHTLLPAVWPSCLSQLLTNFLLPGESRFCSYLSVSWEGFSCSKFPVVLFLLVVQEEPHPLLWCLYPTCNISYKPCPRHGFYATCPVCWPSPCSGFALSAAASSKRYGSFQREPGRRPADFLLACLMLPCRRNKFLS